MNKYQGSAVDSNEPPLTSAPWVIALFKQFVSRNNIKICLEEKRKSGFTFTSLTHTFLSIKGPPQGHEREGVYPNYMGIAVQLPLESFPPSTPFSISPSLLLGRHHTYRRCNCPRISINWGNKSNSSSYQPVGRYCWRGVPLGSRHTVTKCNTWHLSNSSSYQLVGRYCWRGVPVGSRHIVNKCNTWQLPTALATN